MGDGNGSLNRDESISFIKNSKSQRTSHVDRTPRVKVASSTGSIERVIADPNMVPESYGGLVTDIATYGANRSTSIERKSTLVKVMGRADEITPKSTLGRF